MKLDLDPTWLRLSMDLWRKTVNMEIPIHASFRVHFFEQRSTILKNFSSASGSWLTVLNACKAEADSQVEFDALKLDVASFKSWADSELQILIAMAGEEAAKD